LFFVAIGIIGDLASGREISLPSPVRLTALVALWATTLALVGRWNHSRMGHQ
jgi:hypothetical protein